MRVIRKAAYQGHAVPATAGYPRGPFNPEILAQPVIVFDDNDPDDVFPPGATAQNGYRGVQMFRCRDCGAIVREEDVESHRCEVDDGEG